MASLQLAGDWRQLVAQEFLKVHFVLCCRIMDPPGESNVCVLITVLVVVSCVSCYRSIIGVCVSHVRAHNFS